jgi:hypothetical protein
MRWIVRGERRGAVVALLGSLWIGTYTRSFHPSGRLEPPGAHGARMLTIHATPSWTVPGAIALGAAGAIFALLIYRPRLLRR